MRLLPVLMSVCGLLLSASHGLAADIRRIEAVGSVPIHSGERSAVGPKEAAIDAALREAVHRIANDFLLDADSGEGDSQSIALQPVLGNDMVRFTRSFRIIEDRGERPALFVEEGGAATEYVVIVEVQVDAGRVEQRLVERGLISRSQPAGVDRVVRLEVVGLEQYAAYEELRALILERLGADSVAPLEMERGRSVLAVKTRLGTADLLHRLLAVSPGNMEIAPLDAEGDSLRVSVQWTPPQPEDSTRSGRGATAPARAETSAH